MTSNDAALQRLAASRATIDAELRKLQGPPIEDETVALAHEPQPTGLVSALATGFETLKRGLRLWWRRHPARPVVEIAADAGALALKPLVRTHPVAAVSLAMAAGAAMVVWRPWRSRVTAAVWAGLGAQLTAGLVRSVLNPGTLLALLGNLPRPPAAPPPSSPDHPSPPS
jgi:hypothetical protein